MTRKHNFNPGPSVLPVPVLENAKANLLNYRNTGIGVMEMSHRSDLFLDLLKSTKGLLRELLAVPEDFHILFCTGGATQQFSMIPLNLLGGDAVGAYSITGAWGDKAEKEARKFGKTIRINNSNEPAYNTIQPIEEPPEPASYLHYTSNNTIFGTQWRETPQSASPLICDASSDILSRPIDFSNHKLVYAGAQKNAGTAGVTVVFLRKDFAPRNDIPLPLLLNYETFIEKNSLYNTPPVFPIYIMFEVLEWIKRNGGIKAIEENNKAKANLLYQTLDQSELFQGYAEKNSRSHMNVTFTLKDEPLTDDFLSKAEKHNIIGLRGHRSVGGCRASLYNALPLESVQALVDFMKDFDQ